MLYIYIFIFISHRYVVAIYMPIFLFCHSMTGCADSAISGVKMLYHATKNAILCGQECYICQCVYLELTVILVVSDS